MGAWFAVGAAVVCALTPLAWTRASALGRTHAVDGVPGRPTAVVLGAAAWDDGPSPLLARRLDIALALYRAGRVGRIVVSGDNRETSRRETDTMTAYLVEHGVPAAQVEADRYGYRTWDTCVRVRDLFGVHEAVMVTQAFHLPRTIALARAAGIDAVGVGDRSMGARRRSTVIGHAREAGASVKALRDAVLRPEPAHTEV
ncbi:SanA/YdcF family protein [Nocardiopsis salina]|uniref:SanA/YdcF family protein n=1 Tax=Nocardiopsis salina TaxID=245836 RepID=UPI00034D58A6|nr:ElyC/SanA/YdcF family protein [Nocardiopsis salina]